MEGQDVQTSERKKPSFLKPCPVMKARRSIWVWMDKALRSPPGRRQIAFWPCPMGTETAERRYG